MARRPINTLGRGLGLALLLSLPGVARAEAAPACAANPQQFAASYDYRLGTQAFGTGMPSKRTTLAAQASEIRAMGSNIIKFALGRRQGNEYGFGDAAKSAQTTLDYVRETPRLRQVLDMDFTYYQFWTHGFADVKWRDGLSKGEAAAAYQEIHDFTAWLLKRYKGSGKTFMLGNWEGDWLLYGGEGKDATPPPEAIQGMIDWLNIRQKAVDDAKAAIPHPGVEVYHYVEVNQVQRALDGKPSVALSVLPSVNVDLVSYSSYDSIKRSKEPDLAAIRTPLSRAVRFLEGQLQPKPGLPFANRVFIGEYGYHANSTVPMSVEAQYLKSRYVMQVAIELDLPFALIWQLYNNERSGDGTSAEMGLIADQGERRALYYLHQQYLGAMSGFVADSCRQSGQPPAPDAFKAKALEVLQSLSFERMEAMARAHRHELANPPAGR